MFATFTVSVPGRINLIGEHLDYHSLPVPPMAIQRRLRVGCTPCSDGLVRAVSTAEAEPRAFVWGPEVTPEPPGD